MYDLLPQLKKNATPGNIRPAIASHPDFYFLLAFDEKGAYVQTVDKRLESIEMDHRYSTGDEGQTLRTFNHIREELQYQISWDSESPESKVYLAAYPYLIFQLIRCHNLLDAEGKAVSVANGTALLRLYLEADEAGIHPSIRLLAEGNETSGFSFLTDAFVMAENKIHAINAIGENFHQLAFFLDAFPKEMLEQYLSIFYSYIENVELIYDDYEVVFSDSTVATSSALLFEKVDGDKALYLRVVQSLQELPVGFLEQFDVDWIATLTLDRKVLLKRIVQSSLEHDIAVLRKQIMQYAPDKIAQKDIYQDGNFFIIPPETAGPFLLQALPQLLGSFRLIGTDKLKEYRVKPVQPKLNVTLASGIDFLEGEVNVDIEGESFSLKQLLTQYQKQKYIILSDDTRAILDNGYIKRLERLFKSKKGAKEIQISFFDLPEVEDMLQQRLEGEAFVRHRKIYEGFNNLATQKLKLPDIKATLRPYQLEGVKWIKYLHDNNLGGCLADDMGLGKTLQAITMLALLYPKEKKPTLIVMPRTLLFNWQNELARFAPQLTVYTYYGSNRDMKEAMKHQLILTTYAIVRNDAEQYCKQTFHYVILDESQNIKSTGAQVTQAVLLLKAKHRLALSGTPVENNLTELYSLFRFLNPAMFGSLDDFNLRYTFPIQKENDKDILYGLRRKIYPFMLRRLKKDVLKELPDRIDNTYYVEMSEEQARFYEQRRRYYYQQVKQTIATEGIQKSQFVMFQALNELRRIASVPESLSDGTITSPKLELLLESVTEAVSNGHKAVIFFNYIAGIELVGEQLNDNGIDFTSMTGSTRDRKSVIERFQNDPRCRVLLMTLKTGGVGLNLTAADTVYIFEPWWNKAAEEQAINRLHRFGQKAKVLCYSLITQGSIEEKICLLQQRKAELFEGLIGSDTTSAKQLDEEDINYILG